MTVTLSIIDDLLVVFMLPLAELMGFFVFRGGRVEEIECYKLVCSAG